MSLIHSLCLADAPKHIYTSTYIILYTHLYIHTYFTYIYRLCESRLLLLSLRNRSLTNTRTHIKYIWYVNIHRHVYTLIHINILLATLDNFISWRVASVNDAYIVLSIEIPCSSQLSGFRLIATIPQAPVNEFVFTN